MEQIINKEYTNSTLAQNKFKLEDILSSDKNSIQYFSDLRWNKIRRCPRCKQSMLYYLKLNRYHCKKCRYKFDDFTGTYFGKLKIKPSLRTHLLVLYVLEQPAKTCEQYGKCNKSTIERTFRLFRQSIYDKSLIDLQNLKLSGEIEIDEKLFDNRHKIDMFDWASLKQQIIIFGIYYKNEKIVTFPITDRKYDELVSQISPIKNDRDDWSLYYDDEQPVYAIINMKNNDQQMIGGNDYEEGIPINTIPQKNFNILIRIEEFWSEIKFWLHLYRGVPKQYFHLYLKEIEFRFNNRYKDMFHELSKLLVEPLPTI